MIRSPKIKLLFLFSLLTLPLTLLIAEDWRLPYVSAAQADAQDSESLCLDFFTPTQGVMPKAEDFSASVCAHWNEAGLHLRVERRDDELRGAASPTQLYDGDCIEIFVADVAGEAGSVQILLAAPLDESAGEARFQIFDRRSAELQALGPCAFNSRFSGTGQSYTIALSLPWKSLGMEADKLEGRQIGLQFFLNDFDSGEAPTKLIWHPSTETWRDPSGVYPLTLAKEARAPAPAFVRLHLLDTRRLGFEYVGSKALAGKQAEVRLGALHAGGPMLAQATQSEAYLVLALPEGARPDLATLALTLDGKPLRLFNPLGTAEERQLQFTHHFHLSPVTNSVFSGTTLPHCSPVRAEEIKALIGPFRHHNTFYDRDYKEVAEVQRAGRYGLVTTLTNWLGETYEMRNTLFRTPEDLNWRGAKLDAKLRFPEELGLKEAVLEQQQPAIADFFKRYFRYHLHETRGAGALLSALYELDGEAAGSFRHHYEQRDRHWWEGFDAQRGVDNRYDYVLELPSGYEKRDEDWPLLVFLHGSGERGNDTEMLWKHGPLKEIRKGRELPFVVLVPQCPVGQWWFPPRVKALTDKIVEQYRIDPDRIYLTGLSMGGYGTWATAHYYPNAYAALAPVCGGGYPSDVASLKGTPIWVFHGAKDRIVPLSLSEEMVEALQAVGHEVTFTVYPEAGHDSWSETYANPALYDWFLEQRL